MKDKNVCRQNIGSQYHKLPNSFKYSLYRLLCKGNPVNNFVTYVIWIYVICLINGGVNTKSKNETVSGNLTVYDKSIFDGQVDINSGLCVQKIDVGDGKVDAVIESKYSTNLKLQTGASETGHILLFQGKNGDIDITPNGSGVVNLRSSNIIIGASDGTIKSKDKDSAVIISNHDGTNIYRIGPDGTITNSNRHKHNIDNDMDTQIGGSYILNVGGMLASIEGSSNTQISINTRNLNEGIQIGTQYNKVPITIGTNDSNLNLNSIVNIGNDLTVTGNLNVLGTTSSIQVEQTVIRDPAIELNYNKEANGSQIYKDPNGGGIILIGGIQGETHTILYDSSENAWKNSENVQIPIGKSYQIGSSNIIESKNTGDINAYFTNSYNTNSLNTESLIVNNGASVKGDTNINGNLIVSLNNNTSIGGELDVNGKTTLGGTVEITGVATINSNLLVSGNTTIGDETSTGNITSNGEQNLLLQTNNGVNSGIIEINNGENGNINITPNGNGKVKIQNTSISSGSIVSISSGTQNGGSLLDINGSIGQTALNISNGNTILGGNLTITGNTTLNSSLLALGNAVVGDGTSTGNISSNGEQNLLLQTNNGSNSGKIEIFHGTGGNINITPSGTGRVVITNLDATLNSSESITIDPNSAGKNGLTVKNTAGINGGDLVKLGESTNVTSGSILNVSSNNQTGGNLINISGTTEKKALNITNGILNTTGVITINNNTGSNTTNSGALIVTGGVGIGGNTHIGGSTIISDTLVVTGLTTLTGALDANSTADIADTLKLSKPTGTGLSVVSDATVGGTLRVTGIITGNVTGDLTGNAVTATKIASITNSDIVQLTATQTLSNKTLTSPTITGTGAIAGVFTGNVTGNADTATKIASITNSNIVQLTATQTLTNKTLTSPNINDNLVHATAGGSIGFFGQGPVLQQNTTNIISGFTAGSGTGANNDSTFTGNVGSTAYTIGDIVAALKKYGLLQI